MGQNFLLSFQVVFPLFFMMALGYVLKQCGVWNDITLKQLNNITFRVFLPVLVFLNIFQTDIDAVFQPKLLVFVVSSLLILYFLLFIIVPLIEKNNARRGVMIQAVLRSTYVILGLPVTISLFGQENAGIASMLIAVVIPMYNILSVIALEFFRGGKVNIKKILLGIMKNPLIIASLLGVVALLFNFQLPALLQNPINDLAQIATPLALMVLGGSFNFQKVKASLWQLIFCIIGRLVVVPAVFLPIAAKMGFSSLEMTALLAVYAAPAAVSSFTMAQQMDADDELAGQAVVFGSLLSIFTMFLWIFILKQFQII